jgi:uncharacterized protein YlxW (UPF0749 family)
VVIIAAEFLGRLGILFVAAVFITSMLGAPAFASDVEITIEPISAQPSGWTIGTTPQTDLISAQPVSTIQSPSLQAAFQYLLSEIKILGINQISFQSTVIGILTDVVDISRNLQARVAALEQQGGITPGTSPTVSALQSQVNTLQTQVNSLQAQIDALQRGVSITPTPTPVSHDIEVTIEPI